MREELLQTGHHHGGAAEVEVLEPGLVDPLLTEDRLLQGGPRQSEDRAASVYHLARHPGGDGGETQVQPPPERLVSSQTVPGLADPGTLGQGGLGQPPEDPEYQLVRHQVEEVHSWRDSGRVPPPALGVVVAEEVLVNPVLPQQLAAVTSQVRGAPGIQSVVGEFWVGMVGLRSL